MSIDEITIVTEEETPADTLELVVTEKSVGSLETNISRLEMLVDQRLEDYRPENYKGDADLAKKDRAELNKAKQTIQRSRINLIAELMKPYSDFEDRCKNLEKKIDNASKALDEIVKIKENEEKERKRNLITALWETRKCDLFSVEKIFNPKWLNKTFKESDITAEMDRKIEKTYKDLKTIEKYCQINDVEEETIKAHYLISLDIEETIEYCDELQKKKEIAQKEKEERTEREHQTTINRQQKELVKEVIDFEKDKKVLPLVEQVAGHKIEPVRKEFVISVKCFDEDLIKLKATMNALGIEYSVQELNF